MRVRLVSVAAMVSAMIVAGSSLCAQSIPAPEVVRAVSPDGSFAVSFPCRRSDIVTSGGHDAPMMVCINKGLVFGAGRETLAAARGATPTKAFEMFRDIVRSQFGVARVQDISVSGHRAFTYLCENSDGQPCKLVVEMPSGAPIMLTGGDNPAANATAAVWHQNSARVSAFFGTLEFLPQ